MTYKSVKLKVYFEHSIWNRLVHDNSGNEKKKQQEEDIKKIINFRDRTNKILIFTSEAVISELFPLKDSGEEDLRKKNRNFCKK